MEAFFDIPNQIGAGFQSYLILTILIISSSPALSLISIPFQLLCSNLLSLTRILLTTMGECDEDWRAIQGETKEGNGKEKIEDEDRKRVFVVYSTSFIRSCRLVLSFKLVRLLLFV